MKVIINKHAGLVTVEKEPGDIHFYRSGYTDAESIFLYHVKKELIKQGYDCIKKRMYKDGHMVDDLQQYIRDRKSTWFIFNRDYAIYDAGEQFNKKGVVDLIYID